MAVSRVAFVKRGTCSLPIAGVKSAIKQHCWCKSRLVMGSWLLGSLGDSICPGTMRRATFANEADALVCPHVRGMGWLSVGVPKGWAESVPGTGGQGHPTAPGAAPQPSPVGSPLQTAPEQPPHRAAIAGGSGCPCRQSSACDCELLPACDFPVPGWGSSPRPRFVHRGAQGKRRFPLFTCRVAMSSKR